MIALLAPLCLAAALALPSGEQPALAEGFAAGVKAYDAQDWDQAIAAWEGLLRYRVEHAALEYNLANAYVKKQDYGRAVLHYERALRLDPQDGEARENLNLVRGLLVDEVGSTATGVRWLVEEAGKAVALEESTLAAFVAWELLGVCVLVALLRPGPLRRAAIGLAVLAALLLAVAGPLAWLQIRAAADRSRLVVLEPAAEARSGPGEHYTTAFTVHEGLVVLERESVQGWTRVALPNGLDGWLRSGALERI